MCTGAILLYRIPRIVVGENVTYKGGDEYLRSKGVEVIVVDDEECKELMNKFIKEHPEVSKFSVIYSIPEIGSSMRNGMRTSERIESARIIYMLYF